MSADFDATVARVKPGDEVTATFQRPDERETYLVSGTAWLSSVRSIGVGNEIVRFWNGKPGTDLTDLVINKPAPDPEPPIGSVVLDADDEAWQLLLYGPFGTPYWQSAAGNARVSWWRLNDIYAPLRVIYTPEVES